MAFREIFQDPLESLFEPSTEGEVQPAKTVKPKLALPTLNLKDSDNIKLLVFTGSRVLLAGFLVVVGLWASGTINATPSARFSGELARIVYLWQFGNLLAMVGVVLGYDTLKRFF
jgi:hypothetical protein